MNIEFFDDRRDLIVPGDKESTIAFCVEHFIDIANRSIKTKGTFKAALSGGSTPKAVFSGLASEKYRNQIDWSKVFLFWSDERCVGPEDPESNFRMAMDAGFSNLPIPKDQIFRMKGEGDPEKNARDYEKLLIEQLPEGRFDLVMLGLGEDGHIASLFPNTHALHSGNRLVEANFIPQKELWRLTLTFCCINAAHTIVLYVLGHAKSSILKKVLSSENTPDLIPAQRVGTPEHKALIIADSECASPLLSS